MCLFTHPYHIACSTTHKKCYVLVAHVLPFTDCGGITPLLGGTFAANPVFIIFPTEAKAKANPLTLSAHTNTTNTTSPEAQAYLLTITTIPV